MALLALLNDVESELDSAGLVVGDSDSAATKEGEQQALTIAKNIHKPMGRVDILAASPAVRLMKLLHNIRVKSTDAYLSKVPIKYFDALKERSFGVLNGSKMNINSELFSHTRLCAEDGESIAQVRRRMMKIIDSLCQGNKRVLIVSHPFACQVACNTMLGISQVALTTFWFKKGAFALFERTDGWKLKKALNLISEEEHDIYAELVV
jgi:broad specificity phosphatase PhoE